MVLVKRNDIVKATNVALIKPLNKLWDAYVFEVPIYTMLELIFSRQDIGALIGYPQAMGTMAPFPLTVNAEMSAMSTGYLTKQPCCLSSAITASYSSFYSEISNGIKVFIDTMI